MLHSTQNLQLYSNVSDNKIGVAVVVPAVFVRETETYYEYVQEVVFKIDAANSYRTRYTKWRQPKEGFGFWQFDRIVDNDSTLVKVDCVHIMRGIYPYKGRLHRAKIGGAIQSGELLPATMALSVQVSSNGDGSYQLTVNNGAFVFQFSPDLLSPENADEVDFATE
jgi:hypothetical protein